MTTHHPYERGLDRNAANYVPLTPLSFLARTAQVWPQLPAVVHGERRYSWREVYDRCRRLASALAMRGVGPGHTVAAMLPNTPEMIEAHFGVPMTGAVLNTLNTRLDAEALAFMLAHGEATVLLTDTEFAPVIERALARLERRPLVIDVDDPLGPGGRRLGETGYEDFIAGGDPDFPWRRPEDEWEPIALNYTSGTTGNPKGVMVTHLNMVFAAGSIAEYLRLRPHDRILGVVPLAFDYGLYQLLMSVHIGGTLVLERSFAYPAQILKRVDEERVTVFPGVPTIFATLLSTHQRTPLLHTTVERVTNTAAALPPTFHDPLREIFPNALVFRMYGLTECKRVSYLEPELLEERPTSVGKAIPGTQTLVLDAEGNPVEPGETGILHVRGPHVMAGYWRQPELSAEMLVDGPLPGERMLCTHDHFTIDEEGFLYFVGRSDDIIKTRGEKVSPIEVENALYAIPGVREAAVLGVPDELLGEAIHAYVALDDGVELTERDLAAACRERLEGFMVPSKFLFVDELPKTTTGKIRKKGLLTG